MQDDCNTMRQYLHREDSSLAKRADHIWEHVSKNIHAGQTGRAISDSSFNHCLRVEENIWKLITSGSNRNNFNPVEIFLLSVAACCHDYDKAINMVGNSMHGVGSGKYILEYFKKLDLNLTESIAIDHIIACHAFTGRSYSNKLTTIPEVLPVNNKQVDLHLLAVLLKAGDTLDLGNSRIVEEKVVSEDVLSEMDRMKYFARKNVLGYTINGTRILVTAIPDNIEESNMIREGFNHLYINEWNPIVSRLKFGHYPYDLKLEVDDSRINDTHVELKGEPKNGEHLEPNRNILPSNSQDKSDHHVEITRRTENICAAACHIECNALISSEIPYCCILSGVEHVNEFRKGDIHVEQSEKNYSPGSCFVNFNNSRLTPIENKNTSAPHKCRLESYDVKSIQLDKTTHEYVFRFSEITYFDYLITNGVLDEKIPDDTGISFRDKYAKFTNLRNFKDFPLSNICGVGLFLITDDNMIIISKHSKYVSVYENAYSYSASGTMDWNNGLHPFNEIIRETTEEINHVPDIDDMYMYGFGYDMKKLYFQFSFFERTAKRSDEIINNAIYAPDYNAEMEELIAIPFRAEDVVRVVKNGYWEPAAAFNLLTLGIKEFGHDIIINLLENAVSNTRIKEFMLHTWESRARRTGLLPVMSNRYQYAQLPIESDKYVNAVMSFIGEDINNSDVVEIGGGIGRFTKLLAIKASRVTCLDISGEMIRKNKIVTKGLHEKITYLKSFAQEYRPDKQHDISVVSLVLIHNTNDNMLNELAKVISGYAKSIYLFEHIDRQQGLSNETKLRSEEYLLDLFPCFRVENKRYYQLFQDTILFAKLTRL